MNELYFCIYAIIVSCSLLIALRMSKEALIALIGLQWVLANLFVTKQIHLFGLDATASDALAIGATLGLNLVQEYFGKAAALSTIWVGFFCLLFYTITSALHCGYIPSLADSSHIHFCALLSPMPRIAIASLVVYLISQYLEYILYGFLSIYLRNRHFLLRNYASTTISQAVDTILFSFLGLYGIIENIGQVILISYAIKIMTIAVAGPFIAVSRKLLPLQK